MPSTSQLPSSFASAAAAGRGGGNARGGDTRGSGDWSRRENRSTNGTLTLRRSSTNPFGTSHQTSQSEGISSTPTSELPPIQSQLYSSNNNEAQGDCRYSKSNFLEIFRAQQASENSSEDVSRLFASTWDPGHTNGTNGRGWGKSDSATNSYGPEACWDDSGSTLPIGLEEMSEEEKNLFASDVNSPLKPPPQNANKDQTLHSGLNGRKTSVSYRDGPHGVSSPTSSRPGTRRRETSDSVSLSSPSGTNRFPRDENGPISPFLSRKINESSEERTEDNDKKVSNPFGGLMRSSTSGNAFGNGQSSPWGTTATTAGSSAMGSFGSFAMPSATTPNEKRSAFGNVRGESRFANLMSKDSTEDLSPKPSDAGQKSWRSRPRTDTDPYGGDESGPSGSAALGGDNPPAPQQRSGVDTPSRQISSDFGMSDIPGFRDLLQRRDQPQQTPHGHPERHNEPLSPTETNPFRSPPSNERDAPQDTFGGDNQLISRLQGLGGVPENTSSHFNTIPRFDGSDRSQTSSAGATKPFPSLGGLGGLAGWPTSSAMGTPDRERSGFQAFGNSIFGPSTDVQSPSLGFMPTAGFGTAGRGSKLGSLFPAAMQAQMQGADTDQADHGEQRQASAFGSIGKNAFGLPSQDTDSPMRTNRNAFEDLFPSANTREQQSPFTSGDVFQAFSSAASQAPTTASSNLTSNLKFSKFSTGQSDYQLSQASSDSSQVPQNQQRQMVYPDRVRWVYLDPQGQTQGPWSGLEMHDWYKANFFTADLSVKKVEDAEFEPLGQLIRRIGNSREPFLVPQIGIPHGPEPTQLPPFTPAAVTPGVTPGVGGQPGSVQPPFAGAFPSFGTTLTAEQQNNLERRKQEEQFLMARQREHLVRFQQHMQTAGLPAALHHQSSAHSLHSQPSFGSINMPTPGQLGQTNITGFFDHLQRSGIVQPALANYLREEDIARSSINERQQLLNITAANQQDPRNSQIAQILAAKQEQEREQIRLEQLQQSDPQVFADRLREFEQLRAHEEQASQPAATTSNPIAPPQQHNHQIQQHEQPMFPERHQPEPEPQHKEEVEEHRALTLTERIQKTASAKQTPQPAAQPESPWNKVQPGLPMPFPPPQSTTPLPAPTAQRGRSNLPEALNVESRSRSGTPDLLRTTPSIAPWAKENIEAPKGPSLKEIQEIEAKKAAKAEELAVAARRAQLEQDLRNAQSAAAAPAPGLPTTSTWGASASPNSPLTGVSSVWAKPATAKVHAPSAASNKKTLADIQREEEARKQKLAAAAAAATASNSTSGVSGGKRYADLASKPMTPATSGGAAWSTVGAGGKVKIPTGPAVAVPAQRVISTPVIAKPTKPVVTTTRTGNPVGTSKQDGAKASEELVKWAKGALGKGLNADINVDEFISTLLNFPPELTIITDSVYASSNTIDARHFAEEFIRRRKLADKGIIESASANGGFGGFMSTAGGSDNSKSGGGGWSEVAKKGPPKVEPDAIGGSGFRVVPSKKKGKK